MPNIPKAKKILRDIIQVLMTDVSKHVMVANINEAIEALDEPQDAIEAIIIDIYGTYPRHTARPAALRAIKAAINRGITPGKLLERTQLYAKCRAGQDPMYTPHPATWFNQERYNDDEREWAPNKLKKSTGYGGIPPAGVSDDAWGTAKDGWDDGIKGETF